jgi:hypothetical protein
MSGIALDEIGLSTGAGAVDADTLRVELSTESLAALENIQVTVQNSEIEITNDTGNPIPVTGNFSDVLDTAILNSAANVAVTAAQVLVSPLANRKSVTIQNEGNQSVYIGSSAGVTSSNGIKISKNSSATFNWGPNIAIFMISASGSQSVRFLEGA